MRQSSTVRKKRFFRSPGRLWNRTKEARALCGFQRHKGEALFCFFFRSHNCWRKAVSYAKFLKTQNARFRTAKPKITLSTRKWYFFEQFFSDTIFETAPSRKWSPYCGQHRRPKLASGFVFPHNVGGTSVLMSRTRQHSSTTSRICPVLLLCPVSPRARLQASPRADGIG